MCIFGKLVHIFGELVHIFGELANLFGKLVHFRLETSFQNFDTSFENLGAIMATGVYYDTNISGRTIRYPEQSGGHP